MNVIKNVSKLGPYFLVFAISFLTSIFWIKGKIFDGLFYKEAIALSGVAALFLTLIARGILKKEWEFPGLHWIFIFVSPILLSLPGMAIHQGVFNSNFCRELALYAVCLGVALLVYKSFREGCSKESLLNFISGTLVIIFIGVFFEQVFKISFHMSAANIPSRGAFTFGNPNYLSGYLAIAIPLVLVNGPLCLLFESRSEKLWQQSGMRFLLLGTCCGFGALFLTPSLGSLFAVALASGFGLACLLLLKGQKIWKNKRFYQILAGIVTFALIAEVSSGFKMSGRINSLFVKGENSSLSERIGSWKVATDTIAEAPVFGFGAGSSYDLFFHYRYPGYKLQSQENIFSHTHNELLELAQETGILGSSLLLVLGLFLFACLMISVKKNKSETYVYFLLSIAAALIAYVVDGMVSLGPRIIGIKLILGFVMGLYLIADFEKKILPIDYFKFQRTSLIAFSLVALTTCALFLPRLQAIWRFDSFYYLGRKATATELREHFEYFEKRVLIIGMVQVINEAQSIDHETIPEYVTRLRKIVDDYVGVAPILSAVLIRKNKFDEAWEISNTYSKKDPYHTFNNQLMLKLSVLRNDKENYIKTLERELIVSARWKNYSSRTSASDYIIELTADSSLPLASCYDLNQKTVCRLSRTAVDRAFSLMRTNTASSREELKKYFNDVYAHELKIGQFMEKTKMPKNEFDVFLKNIKELFGLEDANGKLSSELAKTIQKNYYTNNALLRPFVQFQGTSHLKKKIAENAKRINELKKVLSKDLDLDLLAKKKAFTIQFINFIVGRSAS